MAGRKRYEYGEQELAERLQQYFAALDNDPTRRGGPSDLLSALQLDMPTAMAMARETVGPYKGCGRLMRQAATRLRAHLETSPAWAGSNGSKSVFLIKQQLWDGQAYADKRESGGPAEIQVTFGPGRHVDTAFD